MVLYSQKSFYELRQPFSDRYSNHVMSALCAFRIQKATESLRTFQPSADPCFDEFVLDTSREETLLKEMCFGGGTTHLFQYKWCEMKMKVS